jgi:hypothetical protein
MNWFDPPGTAAAAIDVEPAACALIDAVSNTAVEQCHSSNSPQLTAYQPLRSITTLKLLKYSCHHI